MFICFYSFICTLTELPNQFCVNLSCVFHVINVFNNMPTIVCNQCKREVKKKRETSFIYQSAIFIFSLIFVVYIVIHEFIFFIQNRFKGQNLMVCALQDNNSLFSWIFFFLTFRKKESLHFVFVYCKMVNS